MTDSRPTVVRVLGSLSFGGAEMRNLELVIPLQRAGVDTHFVCLSGNEGELAADARARGAQVHPMPLGFSFPLRFVALLRRLPASAVHSDVATFSGAILLLARIARVPVRMAHFRSDGDGKPDTLRMVAQRALMRRLVHRFATHILGVSPGSLEYGYAFRWKGDSRCRVIPNGVDLDRLRRPATVDLKAGLGLSARDLVLLHVGRPAPEKRRWLIPRFLRSLTERNLVAHVGLVGPRSADDDARVSNAAAESEVTGLVHFLGSTREVGGLLSQADALILPSSREGLPGVVLEALAVGTPVVASDLPGCRYIAQRLPNVWLVEPDASEAEWSAALAEALQTDRGRDARLAASQKFERSEFSIEAATSALNGIYRSAQRG